MRKKEYKLKTVDHIPSKKVTQRISDDKKQKIQDKMKNRNKLGIFEPFKEMCLENFIKWCTKNHMFLCPNF